VLKQCGDTTIIMALAQWSPGTTTGYWYHQYVRHYGANKVNIPSCETLATRLEWFVKCIGLIEDMADGIDDFKVAVPYGIGCGLAGGNWRAYKRVLTASSVSFIVYKL
jgi:hypothetical protein